MTETIRIRKAPGKWVVFAKGAIYGESQHALEVTVGDGAPVIYIPRADIAMAFFDKTDKTSTSAQFGTASHYSIDTKSTVLENVAWSFEAPGEAGAQIAGHLAFTGDPVNVERQ